MPKLKAVRRINFNTRVNLRAVHRKAVIVLLQY